MLVNVLLLLLNLFFMITNYKLENYKTAIFSGVAVGVVLVPIVTELLK